MKNDSRLFPFKMPGDSFFDSNKDGKLTGFETIMRDSYWIQQHQWTEQNKTNNSSYVPPLYNIKPLSNSADNSDEYEWREYCEDGFEYGLDPEDFETEEEYAEALENVIENAQINNNIELSLTLSVDSPSPNKLDEIKEEDYLNKRRYNAARTLANDFLIYSNEEFEQKEKVCCQFILDNADTLIAANYLSHDSGFLYAQAINDNFDIPCSLPDEDETREMEFYQVLSKIAKRDISLSFQIWSWCLEQFLPYAQYDEFSGYSLSSGVLDNLHKFSNKYKTELVCYLSNNPAFLKKIMCADSDCASDVPELISIAIAEKLYSTADELFKMQLEKANGDWKEINRLTQSVIFHCENYKELESIEYFRDNLLPLIKAIPDRMVQDEISEWEKDIADYINMVENDCEQYAYTRKNAWRATAPDGKEYGLEPRYYDTEQEYLDALSDAKYGWRKWYSADKRCGLNVNDFETLEDFQKALDSKCKEQYETEKQTMLQKQLEQQKEAVKDKTIYTYCGVLLPNAPRPYSFRTDDTSIQIGDKVIVPIGKDNTETEGTVVSVGQYLRIGAPYPVEKTKMILRKA